MHVLDLSQCHARESVIFPYYRTSFHKFFKLFLYVQVKAWLFEMKGITANQLNILHSISTLEMKFIPTHKSSPSKPFLF